MWQMKFFAQKHNLKCKLYMSEIQLNRQAYSYETIHCNVCVTVTLYVYDVARLCVVNKLEVKDVRVNRKEVSTQPSGHRSSI